MTLRDDLQPTVDNARALVAGFGLRPRTVIVRSRVWSGGKLGAGAAADTDLTISPAPKVREPPARWISDAPGRYEAGDIVVEKVSRTYAESLLTNPVTPGHELLFVVDGREYRLIDAPTLLSWGWSLHLRRRTRA